MSSSLSSPCLSFVGAAALAALAASCLCLLQQNRRLQKQLATDHDAEKKTVNDGDNNNNSSATLAMHSIGRITSPFPQRAGCPRQGGALAPSVVSHLQLEVTDATCCLDGLSEYSHVWIIFGFHLNATGKAKQPQQQQHSTSSSRRTKIRPPRAPCKMGVLATRSPHRPNAVGLSLAYIEKVYKTTIVLHGLDLVDGTPVYDVKPYVPWDRIANVMNNNNNHNNTATTTNVKNEEEDDDKLRQHAAMHTLVVPSWVSSQEDELTQVVWSNEAREFVLQAQQDGVLQPFYPPSSNIHVMDAISEIIAQDPRAIRDGRGQNSEAEFQFTFGSLRITFAVNENRVATIVGAELDQGDVTSAPNSYPHNLALRRQAESQSKATLRWMHPVREGMTEGLYTLQNGTEYKPSEE